MIAAGYGYPSTAWVGAGLAAAGLLVVTFSGWVDRRQPGHPSRSAQPGRRNAEGSAQARIPAYD